MKKEREKKRSIGPFVTFLLVLTRLYRRVTDKFSNKREIAQKLYTSNENKR